MSDPLGVNISAREIYDQIVGLRDDVRSLTQSNEHVDRKLEDHERRMRKLEEEQPANADDRLTTLERWKYGIPPALITGALGAYVSLMKSTGKA